MCTGVAHSFLTFRDVLALRGTAEKAKYFLPPKKQGSPYPLMTHLAYPMMRSTTAMPHKIKFCLYGNNPGLQFYTVIGFQNYGIDPQTQWRPVFKTL